MTEPNLNSAYERLKKRRYEQGTRWADRLSDGVAQFGGSWAFILLFTGIMGVWIVTNTYLLSRPFDRFPFILLNLVLSCVAALQAPFIMMSQNRQEQKDRDHADLDLEINILAEDEIRGIRERLDLIQSHDLQHLHTRLDQLEHLIQQALQFKQK